MRKIGALSVSASLALGLLAGASAIANATPEGDEPAESPPATHPLDGTRTPVESPGAGDPIYGDLAPLTATSERSTWNSTALDAVSTWAPALTTNAATSAYIDPAADRVYQASRSEVPALVFANSLEQPEDAQVATLPDTTGSWAMAMNGNYLAVGTNGNGVNRARVVIINPSEPWGSTSKAPVLPSSSSASAYVMSLAADYRSSEVFWVGTYDAAGAHLYSLNASTGKFQDFTPGTEWKDSQIKYVRSLGTTPGGVVAGLGNPGSVWFLANGASRPVEVEGALGDVRASSVYALASSTTEHASTNVEIVPPSATEDSSTALQSDSPMSGEEQVDERSASVPLTTNTDTEIDAPTNPVENTASVVAGTNRPASVLLLDLAGEPQQSHLIGNGAQTVDQVAIGEDNTAWFTVRPAGDLYSWNLDSPEVPPVRRSSTVNGSETRTLNVTAGVVRGVTGTRQLWRYHVAQGSLSTAELGRGDRPEGRTTAPQGVLQTEGGTLVGGHWRYMVHAAESTFNINVPGEPKAQVLVGDRVYAALYPSASVFEINVQDQIGTFVARADTTQVRPRSLVWNEQTKRLYMATSGVYGTFGGSIALIDPTDGKLEAYPTPVTDQMPFALAPVGEDLIVGTSAAGESVSAPPDSQTQIVRWSPDGVRWNTSTSSSDPVASVTVMSDSGGEYVFALTSRGRALALDANTGETLWTATIPNATKFSAQGDYVLIRVGGTVKEYFPSRSALVEGLALTTNAAWIDLQGELSQTLTLAAVETGATSAGSAQIKNPRVVQRITGSDRYATALAVSQATYASATTAVIATGQDFPDALSAGPLAAQRRGPVLLTNGKELRSDVLQELKRLKVDTVFLAGGIGAVPTTVETELESEGFKVERFGGETRYETSLKIAEEIRRGSGAAAVPVILTTGTVFPDALSATSAAAKLGAAIVLSAENTLKPDVAAYLESNSTTYTMAVGGPARRAAVSGGIPLEWSEVGSDRYQTAALVSSRIFPSAERAYLATGADFPDGLTAGPAAFLADAPVLLSSRDSLESETANRLSRANHVTLVGGKGALSQPLALEVREAG